MIKKILISGFSLAITFILVSAINKPYSGGAPSASSGAPGEQTCAMSTCHDDNSLNSGSALLSIEIPDTVLVGEDNSIKIKIKDVGKIRFGFQVIALDEANKMVGEFIITDSERTQVLGNNSNFPDRNYLTYTYMGTLDKSGESEWEAKWKAYSSQGKVTFYVAAISANNDGGDKGDFTYTTKKSVILTSKIPGSVEDINMAQIKMSVFYNKLKINNPNFDFIKNIAITDINGKILVTEKINTADSKIEINLPELNTGIIVATIQTSTETITKKLFTTHD